MFDSILDYRERQQIRKDRQRKQNMRYLTVFFAVLIVLLLGAYAVDAVTPAEEPKPAAAKVSMAHQQQIEEIEEFAYIVTKPLENLTSEEIDFMGSKAEDPCYEKNALLPEEEMVVAISKCKGLK